MNTQDQPRFHCKDFQLVTYAALCGIEPFDMVLEHGKVVYVFVKNETFDKLLTDFYSRTTTVNLREFVETSGSVRKKLFAMKNGGGK